MMTENKYEQLIQQAIEFRTRAYAPYSDFSVGAALLSRDGQVFGGCNVENGVLGLSICAERVAMSSAVAVGVQEFEAIAVAAVPLATPCGPCRQFMIEFGTDLKVIAVDAGNPNQRKIFQITELLPDHFELN